MKVNVRVIAATNRNLEQAIEKKEFREDLFYRLNVFPVVCPPLRDRKEDIPLLVKHFCQKHEGKIGVKIKDVPKKVMDGLMTYDWPGNIRELENAIERAIVLGTTDHILADDLPEAVVEFQAHMAGDSGSNYHEQVVQMKRKMIIDAVKQTNGNYTAAARLLNLHPNYLHRLIRNLNLKDELK